jgi:methylamine---glutamate N-methyltransferase subunit B
VGASPVVPDPSAGRDSEIPTISIPDVRDYQRINAELAQILDAGHPRVILRGAENQRLLLSGLTGQWSALIEVEGSAGPELAAGLNAPNLVIACRGPAADGAGSALRAGTLLIEKDGGPAVGYAQRGGVIVVCGASGPRAGLNQSGGVLVLLGPAGALTAERQSGGTLFVDPTTLGAHAGHGRRGGRIVALQVDSPEWGLGPADRAVFAPLERLALDLAIKAFR